MISCMRSKAADFVVDLNTLSFYACDNCQLFCHRKFWDQTVSQLQKVYLVLHYRVIRVQQECKLSGYQERVLEFRKTVLLRDRDESF